MNRPIILHTLLLPTLGTAPLWAQRKDKRATVQAQTDTVKTTTQGIKQNVRSDAESLKSSIKTQTGAVTPDGTKGKALKSSTQQQTKKLLEDKTSNLEYNSEDPDNAPWKRQQLSKDDLKGFDIVAPKETHREGISASLTGYHADTHTFDPRTAGSKPYDETYTYDANGNILKLKRNDAIAEVMDDYTYAYYDTTNRLKNINPAAGNTYQYDAIGNLVADNSEGVDITWTPYGKVHGITKGDTVQVTFRYDASGNRVEKKVVKGDTITITRYVRDASGNVMGIYADTTLREQSVYGSSRLGIYRGRRGLAHRTLGGRNYELSNHLGNVMVVITDEVGTVTSSGGLEDFDAGVKVIAANDYYPFGLTMTGRSYSDTTYRYGFNGKEKDENGEFGGTTYDYGFRIYNPRISKFLSVDPLTKDYPWYTPYQFAGNMPIWAIDLDGLEPLVASDYKTLNHLKRNLKLEYCYDLVDDEEVYQVTVSQNFWGIHQSHTLVENSGPRQTELSTFLGAATYVVNHPGNAKVLNKINNMSFRAENDQSMAFQDVANAIRDNLKGERKGSIANTFLHVTGQAIITSIFGRGYANLAGDIHERDHRALMTGDMNGQDMSAVIDNYADIINNQWGQRWGETISKDLGITEDTEWTNDLTSKYLNALQDKISKSMGVKFEGTFNESDDFVARTTEFINANK